MLQAGYQQWETCCYQLPGYRTQLGHQMNTLQSLILLSSRVARVGLSPKLTVTPKGPHLFNPLKPELNPICYLLALLGAHHFLHVSRIRVKLLTLR